MSSNNIFCISHVFIFKTHFFQFPWFYINFTDNFLYFIRFLRSVGTLQEFSKKHKIDCFKNGNYSCFVSEEFSSSHSFTMLLLHMIVSYSWFPIRWYTQETNKNMYLPNTSHSKLTAHYMRTWNRDSFPIIFSILLIDIRGTRVGIMPMVNNTQVY